MHFDLFSDVHVDMNKLYTYNSDSKRTKEQMIDWNRYKQSNILVLPGDLSNIYPLSARLVQEASLFYDNVIFVDGNHDHYRSSEDFTRFDIQEYFSSVNGPINNVTYLKPGHSIVIDGISFIGANGWYNWMSDPDISYSAQRNDWLASNGDSRNIVFDKMPDILAMEHAEAIYKSVVESKSDVVIITHTVPNNALLIQDRSHEWYIGNGSYHNSFMVRIWNDPTTAKKIKAWCFGHTHKIWDVIDGQYGVRFVSNPRGYHGEFPEEGDQGRGPKKIFL